MEYLRREKRLSKPIPVTSFNENITFPEALKTGGSGSFITFIGNNSSFFKKREANSQVDHFNRTKFSKTMGGDPKLSALDSNLNVIEEQGHVGLRNEQVKRQPLKKMSRVDLNLTFDFRVLDNSTLKKTSSLVHFNKQVLHMKTTAPDGSNIQRRIFELREIEHVESLILIIKKKKVNRVDLENAFELLGEKMRGLKKMANRLNLSELSRVREIEEDYKTVLRDKDKILKNFKAPTQKGVEMIEELEFEEKESMARFQESPLNRSIADEMSQTSHHALLLETNPSSSSERMESDLEEKIPSREEHQVKQIKTAKPKPRASNPKTHLSTPQTTRNLVQRKSSTKIEVKKKVRKNQIINKIPQIESVVKQINDTSTKSDISVRSYLPRDSKPDLFPQINHEEKSQSESQIKESQMEDMKRVSRVSRRSSRFKFGEFEFLNFHKELIRESKDISEEGDILEPIKQERLLTINTVSSQPSKEQQGENSHAQRRSSLKYLKIAPKKRITGNINISNNVDLLFQEDGLQDSKNIRLVENVRKANRHGRRAKQAIRPEDEFIYLDINYNKSFVANRDILQHQSSKLGKYMESQNLAIPQELESLKHPPNRQKSNKREYVTAQAVDQLSKELGESSIGDMNNNFYEFEGIRHSSSKKDKIAYYGIRDYTYNEDLWFKRHERLEEKLALDPYEDDLEQKSAPTQVVSTTKYLLNKIYKVR